MPCAHKPPSPSLCTHKQCQTTTESLWFLSANWLHTEASEGTPLLLADSADSSTFVVLSHSLITLLWALLATRAWEHTGI